MTYLRSSREVSTLPTIKTSGLAVVFLLASFGTPVAFAQDQAPAADQPNPAPAQTQPSLTVTIPAGTRLALVLTQPVQSRYVRRGDDIYAQISSPVDSGDQVVIPPGTFVQGTVDKLGHNGSRGEVHLQAMAITFPDGYVTPVIGPMTLQTTEGYAIKDPGPKRVAGAIAMPLAGIGIGALIGHSVGSSQATLTNSLPPGCVGPPPGCLSSSLPIPGSKGKDTAIGAAIGGAVGGIASAVFLFSTHHFFLGAGAPVELTLEHPITLHKDEVAKAVRESAEHGVSIQSVAPPPPPPDMNPETPVNHGTCFTPGTPGTPSTAIPGAPDANGIPGPPTIIPGTPPTPGTPYPCP